MADDKKTETPAVKLPEVNSVTPPLFTKEQEAYIAHLVAETSMNAAMYAVQNMQKNTAPTQPQQVVYNRNAPPVIHEMCEVCKQTKKACSGEHTLIVCYPQKYPEWAGFFPGIKINGVTYRSGHENHRINVPTCAVSTIINAVSAFEQAEKNIHVKRTKKHDSGSIGASGKGAKTANVSWS